MQWAATSTQAWSTLATTGQLSLTYTAICPNCMRSVPFLEADNPRSRCPEGCWRRLHNTADWTRRYSNRLGYRFLLEATRILAWEKRPPYTLEQAREAKFDVSESSDESPSRDSFGHIPGMERRRHFRRYFFYCRGIRQGHETRAQESVRGGEAPGSPQAPLTAPGDTCGDASQTRPQPAQATWRLAASGWVAAMGGMRGVAKVAASSRTVRNALLAFGSAELAHTAV